MHLQLTPGRVPRCDTLYVVVEVRLAIEGFTGCGTGGQLALVPGCFGGVFAPAPEADWFIDEDEDEDEVSEAYGGVDQMVGLVDRQYAM